MAYDSNPAATHNPATGGTPTAAWGDILNANFAHLGGSWTTFTPTWTGAGGNPSIGNGTLTGAYLQIGKTLHVRYKMVAGTTTTFGTGQWSLTLPNSLTSVASHGQVMACHIQDAGTARYVAAAYIAGGATTLQMEYSGASFAVGATVPMTWATSDQFVITGTIEVA